MNQLNRHRVFSKETWQNKNWLRQLNRERIDAGRALALKIVRFFFDRPLKAYHQNQKFDPSQIKKILLFHFDDKIGDLVINTILFRELKKLGPLISLDLITGKNSFDLVDEHPFLNQIFVFKKGFFRTLFFASKLKKEKYDLVIDPRIMTDARTIYLLDQIQPKWLLGFHKQDYRIYSDSINDDFKKIHMREKVRTILQKLGIEKINLEYSLIATPKASKLISRICSNSSLDRFIILNLYAGARFRSFLPNTAERLIKMIRNLGITQPIVLIGPPSKADELRNLVNTLPQQNLFFLSELQKISEVSELVRHSQLVITPDTSLVHIASAYNIPVISVFRDDSDCEEKNSIQWAPVSTFSRVILAFGHTEGEVDVNTFPEALMQKALMEMKNLL